MKKRLKVDMYNELKEKITLFENEEFNLIGIQNDISRDIFIKQLVDSIRRIDVVRQLYINALPIDNLECVSIGFNPIKLACSLVKGGQIEEASWLVFLITHFGKNAKTGWRLLQSFYFGLGDEIKWTFSEVSNSKNAFMDWLIENHRNLKTTGNFSNHRKYESCKPRITGNCILSYVDFIENNEGHSVYYEQIRVQGEESPKIMFSIMYSDIKMIYRFGRMGKFDFLTMLGKCNVIPIEPNRAYLEGATGPYIGGRHLFGCDNMRDMKEGYNKLEEYLDLGFGFQVLEDAICNWQKDRVNYQYFRG